MNWWQFNVNSMLVVCIASYHIQQSDFAVVVFSHFSAYFSTHQLFFCLFRRLERWVKSAWCKWTNNIRILGSVHTQRMNIIHVSLSATPSDRIISVSTYSICSVCPLECGAVIVILLWVNERVNSAWARAQTHTQWIALFAWQHSINYDNNVSLRRFTFAMTNCNELEHLNNQRMNDECKCVVIIVSDSRWEISIFDLWQMQSHS